MVHLNIKQTTLPTNTQRNTKSQTKPPPKKPYKTHNTNQQSQTKTTTKKSPDKHQTPQPTNKQNKNHPKPPFITLMDVIERHLVIQLQSLYPWHCFQDTFFCCCLNFPQPLQWGNVQSPKT